jgi:ABC-type Fe3+/spermidine/putrescine transport system ATPase subunit
MSLAVKAVGIRKSFGEHEVLKGLDLEVAYGEVLCILGPSGSGKSTFLRCINHLETPNGGYVWVDGAIMGYRYANGALQELPVKHLRAQQSQLGMVFQHFNLFAHRTVLGQCHRRADGGARPQARRGGKSRDGAFGAGRHGRQGLGLSFPAFRRPEAARGNSQGARHGAARHAVRRADQRARPGTGR